MRVVRNSLDLFVAAMAMLLGILMDASLVSVFRAHLRRAIATSHYRPVYSHSGRRNRIRF
jgi:hypothetical protein